MEQCPFLQSDAAERARCARGTRPIAKYPTTPDKMRPSAKRRSAHHRSRKNTSPLLPVCCRFRKRIESSLQQPGENWTYQIQRDFDNTPNDTERPLALHHFE